MKRFQLTIVFVLFSAMTIGAGAVAVNSLMAASAERSIISVAESQSQRDAHFIASLVSQLLSEQHVAEDAGARLQAAPVELQPSPAFSTTTLLINAATVLQALDIVDLAIYNTSGERIWSSTLTSQMASRLGKNSLESLLEGETVSGIAENAALLPGEASQPVDLVVTFVPLIGAESGEPVQVLGVSRPVPAGLAALLAESRSTVFKTTLISLSGVFLILLVFVLTADVRIWKRNTAALAIEREQQEKLGLRNQELSKLDRARNRFISAISHELNGPLTVLDSFLGIVLRNPAGNLNKRQLEQLEVARRNGQQMARLVADLSYSSAPENQGLPIVYEEFDVSAIFGEIAESLSHDLGKREQTLELQVDPALGPMSADRGRMVQVVSNLIGNASKYSPHGTTIRLNATRVEDDLEVVVADEGIGISEKDREHIFEMYWRADNEETHSVPGTGIGLVLARDIVQSHNGTISLESSVGEGTTVTFRVPLKQADTASGESDDEAEHRQFGAWAA